MLTIGMAVMCAREINIEPKEKSIGIITGDGDLLSIKVHTQSQKVLTCQESNGHVNLDIREDWFTIFEGILWGASIYEIQVNWLDTGGYYLPE